MERRNRTTCLHCSSLSLMLISLCLLVCSHLLITRLIQIVFKHSFCNRVLSLKRQPHNTVLFVGTSNWLYLVAALVRARLYCRLSVGAVVYLSALDDEAFISATQGED